MLIQDFEIERKKIANLCEDLKNISLIFIY